jgi:hypothetical protein
MDKFVFEQMVLKRRSTDDQQIHEEMFNILSHKRNADQNESRFHLNPSEWWSLGKQPQMLARM